MKILIGTTNPAKLNYYSGLLKDYDVECINLKSLDIYSDPEETGKDPAENSEIKAKYYSRYSDAVICNDAGLYITDLSFDDKRQPGLKVRSPKGYRFNDDEMIEYYSGLVKSLGGKVRCYYLDGVSVFYNGEVKSYLATDHVREFYMVSTPSDKRRIGWPLDSMSVNDNGEYFIDNPDPIKANNNDFDNSVKNFIIESFGLKKKGE